MIYKETEAAIKDGFTHFICGFAMGYIITAAKPGDTSAFLIDLSVIWLSIYALYLYLPHVIWKN